MTALFVELCAAAASGVNGEEIDGGGSERASS